MEMKEERGAHGRGKNIFRSGGRGLQICAQAGVTLELWVLALKPGRCYIASGNRMNDELERNWKEAVAA
jgi:hypothetical protein